jgi:hypothetical protein
VRLLSQYPSAALLALIGIVLLIGYLGARGRKLGRGDLLFFAIMAIVFDGLVFAMYGMWVPNSPGNLIVFVGLILALPIAAFSTLGVVLVAFRVLHIELTGGKDP